MRHSDNSSRDPIDLERLLPAAVSEILKHEDPDKFRVWLTENLQDYAGAELRDAPTELLRAMAMPVSYMIWNAVPLPGNQFRARPLPLPNRNDPCPCGSGLKYKKCCSNAPPFPKLDPLVFWPLVLQNLSDSQIKQAAERGLLPLEGRTMVAMNLLENDRAREAVALLRPHFEPLPAKGRPMDGMALQVLCDAYDELRQRDEKLALLERITQQGAKSSLRAGAWQRLAVIRIDAHDLEGAREALEKAMRDDPDEPSSAFIELQLLAMQERWEQIRARAEFWLRKLRRPLYDPDAVAHIVEILEAAVDDPQSVLDLLEEEDDEYDVSEIYDETCRRLLDWIAQVSGRPLPAYRVAEEDGVPEGEQQLATKFRRMGLPESEVAKALAMFEEQTKQLPDTPEDADEPGEDDASLILAAPEAISTLEERWQKLFDLAKPFGTQELLGEEWDGWEPDADRRWLEFLVAHPEAGDSLEILDDLAAAMLLYPEQLGPRWVLQGILPLLERAAAIVEKSIAGIDEPRLRWNRTENRAGLRSLHRLYAMMRYGREDFAESERLAALLLKLNPQDNHGVRCELINEWLHRGENEKAQQLAQCYPDDVLVDTRYGLLLALYRLGRYNTAQQYAEQVVEAFPLVARYLVRARVKRPKLSEHGIRIGGEDQAWVYREAMRDVWQQTPGALEWLKKIMKLKGVRV